ncbi:hypothetical protein PPACK8108_LOCUS4089 [Phakopsora pachyrhizi]|uniref:PB1 domain-containing protein n=1 Tax=Phakopsora pachyrhizi TaxID=170000 RepID=A0AAV0AQ45_PHAPC|nr:hypothetical protein PPACK8108_LOCUS4089 [Phakopsora pachyrhizi]
MSLKAEIETWAAALDLYDSQNFDDALAKFENIADSSKILFNIGLIYATLGEHEIAVENFRAATNLDQYLAVAYFQCGVSNFLLGAYQEAIKDFDDALIYLRGNLTIDYDQLGLKFRLYSCEVLFNKGLSLVYLGSEQEGMRDMEDARKEKQTPEHGVIDEAINDRGEGYTVFSIPVGILYRPPTSKVKNLASKNYLGQAKLVAATDATETFVGFTGSERAAARNGTGSLSVARNGAGSMSEGVINAPPIQRRGTTSARLENTRLNTSNSVRRPSGPTSASGSGGPGKLQRSATTQATSSARSPIAAVPERMTSKIPSPDRRGDPYSDDLLDSYNDDPQRPPDRTADWARNTTGGPKYATSSFSSPRAPPSRKPTITGSNYNYEEAGYGSGGDYAESMVSVAMTKIRVKLHHDSDTRGMSIDPQMSLDEFRAKVTKKFLLEGKVSMRYKDEDGSMVTILDDDDWESAVDTARAYAKGRAEGKVEIWVDDL